MMEQKLYWIWLSQIYHPGSTGFLDVLEVFSTPYAVYEATREELAERLGADFPTLDKLADKRMEGAYRIYDFCVQHKVSILTYADLLYPPQLRMISNPPVLLYYRGKFPSLNRKLCVGMVGTRSMTEYGKRTAYKMAYEFSATGAVVVSGMALGCDAVAAVGALEGRGTTIAVLGSGIDVIYPRQHEALFDAIVRYGVVVTEYPPGSPPDGAHFPVRNRIISGLSQGIVVVEGNARSGSLLTAGHAVKQGRVVFAVPGNVGDANAEGPNKLISEGARIARDTADILNYFAKSGTFSLSEGKYKKATRSSQVNERALEALGVRRAAPKTAVHGTGRYAAKSAETPPAETPTFASPAPRAEAPTPTVRSERKPAQPAQPLPEIYSAPEAPAETGTPTVPSDTEREDRQARIEALSNNARLIYEQMPEGRAVPMDFVVEARVSVGNAMLGLAELEIADLVTSLPGGMYLRK